MRSGKDLLGWRGGSRVGDLFQRSGMMKPTVTAVPASPYPRMEIGVPGS